MTAVIVTTPDQLQAIIAEAVASGIAAADWLPFVRGAWRGLRAKVSQCTVRLDGGKVCDKSRRLLSEKYNLDA